MTAALALVDSDARGQARARKLASGFSTSRSELASGLGALQPANDTGETSACAYDFAAESLIWTSKDRSRFGGGLNLYQYGYGDPVDFVDVGGHNPIAVAIVGLGVIFGFGAAAPSDTAQAPADILAMSLSVAGLRGMPIPSAMVPLAPVAEPAIGAAVAEESAGAMCSATRTSMHGAERLVERGFTEAELRSALVTDPMIQADGKLAYVDTLANGRYNVVVMGDRGVVTAIKNMDADALARLAVRYGWHP